MRRRLAVPGISCPDWNDRPRVYCDPKLGFSPRPRSAESGLPADTVLDTLDFEVRPGDGRHDAAACSSWGRTRRRNLGNRRSGIGDGHGAGSDQPRAPEPLIWPALTKLSSGIRSFNGHTDTVGDKVREPGRQLTSRVLAERS